jgi:hypothetical protein
MNQGIRFRLTERNSKRMAKLSERFEAQLGAVRNASGAGSPDKGFRGRTRPKASGSY